MSPAGVVFTLAGMAGDTENIDGLPVNARFADPGDVTVDSSGIIYVADSQNDTIRRIIPGAGATAPSIVTQPANLNVNAGQDAVFSAAIAGTPPFTFQWYYNGVAISGATGGTYTLANAQPSDDGGYSVAITNSVGSVTTSAATLTVNSLVGAPVITVQPQGGALPNGGSVALSVTVTGNAPFTYQWFLNSAAISGATASTYTATAPGSYTVTVTNSVTSTTSNAADVNGGSRLINISTRALVGTGGNIAIAGIYISGPASEKKQVLIRGVGPALSLAPFNIGGALASTTVSLYDSSGKVIASDTGWGNSPVAGDSSVSATFLQATSGAMASAGAFPLTAGSLDSALVADLPPGAYTVELSGQASTTGVGLVEIYETDTSDPAMMVNISTRAQVGTGGNILIGGFVIGGKQPATILVRGIGPALSLAPFNLTGTLSNPVLSIFDSTSILIANNTGWGTAPVAGISSVNATFRMATAQDMSSIGAFALTPGSADSAMVITLPPGAYTAEVSGADSTTGIALVEVYQVVP